MKTQGKSSNQRRFIQSTTILLTASSLDQGSGTNSFHIQTTLILSEWKPVSATK